MFRILWIRPLPSFSIPGLSRDAMLKMTEMELELISNIGKCLLDEKGMRGGISYIAKRFSKANNKYIKCYHSKPSRYIMYLDENNLYVWAMIQYLPYSKFKWLNQEKIEKFDVNLIGANCLDGYILEVDLEYHDELHKLHKN